MGDEADYAIERMIWRTPKFPNTPKKNYCKTCGDEIIWHNANGKWTPMNLDGSGNKTRHFCLPEELRNLK